MEVAVESSGIITFSLFAECASGFDSRALSSLGGDSCLERESCVYSKRVWQRKILAVTSVFLRARACDEKRCFVMLSEYTHVYDD